MGTKWFIVYPCDQRATRNEAPCFCPASWEYLAIPLAQEKVKIQILKLGFHWMPTAFETL